jgi:hypothetical protein
MKSCSAEVIPAPRHAEKRSEQWDVPSVDRLAKTWRGHHWQGIHRNAPNHPIVGIHQPTHSGRECYTEACELDPGHGQQPVKQWQPCSETMKPRYLGTGKREG